MSTNYPGGYDSYPTWQDLIDIIAASIVNNIQDAVSAIEHELGLNPSGDYDTVKARLDAIPAGGRWQLVEEVTLASAATEHVFSGLDGNADKEYLLVFRVIRGVSTDINGGIRFNGDTAGNYAWQEVVGEGSTLSTGRNTARDNARCFQVHYPDQQVAYGEAHIFAPTGYQRPINCRSQGFGSADYAMDYYQYMGHWYNTGSNITSITFWCNQANGLGVNTNLQLWKRA